VDHEGRLAGERADLDDRLVEGRQRVRIGRLLEADVAVRTASSLLDGERAADLSVAAGI
jgi:hypothetical protein